MHTHSSFLAYFFVVENSLALHLREISLLLQPLSASSPADAGRRILQGSWDLEQDIFEKVTALN